MDNRLNLANILALAATTPYGGDRTLSSNTAATLLSAAAFLSNFDNWQGADYDLTDAEKDTIDALVGELVNDLLVEGVPIVSDYVKILEVTHDSDVASLTTGTFDPTDYSLLRLVVTGARTDYEDFAVDHLHIRVNDDDDEANYNSVTHYIDGTTTYQNEEVGTIAAFVCKWSLAAWLDNDEVAGSVDMLVFDPTGDRSKLAKWDGLIGGYTTGRIARTVGSCRFQPTDPVTKLTIMPGAGTYFMIDPLDSDQPSELKIILYGMK